MIIKGVNMDFNEWEGWYKEILETLGFSREGDEKTALLLDKILDEKGCLTIEEFFDEMLEFAALSTVCDVMPIEDESTRHGETTH